MYISTQRLDAYVNRINALALRYLTLDDKRVKDETTDILKGLLLAGGDLGIIDLSSGVEKILGILRDERMSVMYDWCQGPEEFNKHYSIWESILYDALTREFKNSSFSGE